MPVQHDIGGCLRPSLSWPADDDGDTLVGGGAPSIFHVLPRHFKAAGIVRHEADATVRRASATHVIIRSSCVPLADGR